MAMNTLQRRQFPLLAIVFQALFILLFAAFSRVDYPSQDGGRGSRDTSIGEFHRVHMLVVVGLVLLHTLTPTVYHHSAPPAAQSMGLGSATPCHAALFISSASLDWAFSALVIYFFTTAFSAQYALLLHGLISEDIQETGRFVVGLKELTRAEVAAVPSLITIAVLFGRLTPVQFLLLAFLETSAHVLLEHVLHSMLGVHDAGRALSIHCFGTYFAMGCARVCRHQRANPMSAESSHNNESAANQHVQQQGISGTSGAHHSHITELIALLGTLLLFTHLPALNVAAAGCAGDHYTRCRDLCTINSYLALAGSLLATFAASSLADNLGRLNLLHLGTASLAGAVGIAALVDYEMSPWVPMAVGAVAGILATQAHMWITPHLLERRLRVYDAGVVHSVHGLTAVLSVVVSLLYTYVAVDSNLSGSSAPNAANYTIVDDAMLSKWWWGSAIPQLTGLLLTFMVAASGGMLTGHLLNWKLLNQLQEQPPPYEDRNYYARAEMLGLTEAEEGGRLRFDEDDGMGGESEAGLVWAKDFYRAAGIPHHNHFAHRDRGEMGEEENVEDCDFATLANTMVAHSNGRGGVLLGATSDAVGKTLRQTNNDKRKISWWGITSEQKRQNARRKFSTPARAGNNATRTIY